MNLNLPRNLNKVFKEISEFQIIKELGNGAFSVVYLAKHLKSNKLYAIKVLDIKKLNDIHLANLPKEIEIHQELNNAYIIKFHDFIVDDNYIYFILEYCTGGNLFHYINSKELEPKEIKKIFLQTILGIQHMHEKKILMRDLKPENILLNSDNDIKICDFGWSAKIHDFDWLRQKAGTFAYMAPESLKGEIQTFKTDIWALGILLYELFYSKEPFPGKCCRSQLYYIENMELDFSRRQIPILARDLIITILKYSAQNRPDLVFIVNHPFLKGVSEQGELKKNKELNLKRERLNNYEQIQVLGKIEESHNSEQQFKVLKNKKNNYLNSEPFNFYSNKIKIPVNENSSIDQNSNHYNVSQQPSKLFNNSHFLYKKNDSQHRFEQDSSLHKTPTVENRYFKDIHEKYKNNKLPINSPHEILFQDFASDKNPCDLRNNEEAKPSVDNKVKKRLNSELNQLQMQDDKNHKRCYSENIFLEKNSLNNNTNKINYFENIKVNYFSDHLKKENIYSNLKIENLFYLNSNGQNGYSQNSSNQQLENYHLLSNTQIKTPEDSHNKNLYKSKNPLKLSFHYNSSVNKNCSAQMNQQSKLNTQNPLTLQIQQNSLNHFNQANSKNESLLKNNIPPTLIKNLLKKNNPLNFSMSENLLLKQNRGLNENTMIQTQYKNNSNLYKNQSTLKILEKIQNHSPQLKNDPTSTNQFQYEKILQNNITANDNFDIPNAKFNQLLITNSETKKSNTNMLNSVERRNFSQKNVTKINFKDYESKIYLYKKSQNLSERNSSNNLYRTVNKKKPLNFNYTNRENLNSFENPKDSFVSKNSHASYESVFSAENKNTFVMSPNNINNTTSHQKQIFINHDFHQNSPRNNSLTILHQDSNYINYTPQIKTNPNNSTDSLILNNDISHNNKYMKNSIIYHNRKQLEINSIASTDNLYKRIRNKQFLNMPNQNDLYIKGNNSSFFDDRENLLNENDSVISTERNNLHFNNSILSNYQLELGQGDLSQANGFEPSKDMHSVINTNTELQNPLEKNFKYQISQNSNFNQFENKFKETPKRDFNKEDFSTKNNHFLGNKSKRDTTLQYYNKAPKTININSVSNCTSFDLQNYRAKSFFEEKSKYNEFYSNNNYIEHGEVPIPIISDRANFESQEEKYKQDVLKNLKRTLSLNYTKHCENIKLNSILTPPLEVIKSSIAKPQIIFAKNDEGFEEKKENCKKKEKDENWLNEDQKQRKTNKRENLFKNFFENYKIDKKKTSNIPKRLKLQEEKIIPLPSINEKSLKNFYLKKIKNQFPNKYLKGQFNFYIKNHQKKLSPKTTKLIKPPLNVRPDFNIYEKYHENLENKESLNNEKKEKHLSSVRVKDQKSNLLFKKYKSKKEAKEKSMKTNMKAEKTIKEFYDFQNLIIKQKICFNNNNKLKNYLKNFSKDKIQIVE